MDFREATSRIRRISRQRYEHGDTEAPIEVLVAITVHTGQTTQEPLESLYNVSI